MEIANIEVFLKSFTIASPCNQVVRKRFLKPDTLGLVPDGGYSCNNYYSKKALMWLLHMEQTDGYRIMHARNGRKYRPTEHPKYSVDEYCPETKTIYEFFGCFFDGHTCQTFRNINTMCGDTLAEIYVRTMSQLVQITQARYQVKMQSECEFDDAGIVNQKPELPTHPVVEQSPLHTSHALYGVRTEAMRLYYKLRDNETIQYVDVPACTRTFANILNFQSGIQSFTCGTRVSIGKLALDEWSD